MKVNGKTVSSHCSEVCPFQVEGLGRSGLVAVVNGHTQLFANNQGPSFQTWIRCVYGSAGSGSYVSDVVPRYPALTAECPSNCSSSFRGRCVSRQGCACAAGYSGSDCSSLKCVGGHQTCFGRGECVAWHPEGMRIIADATRAFRESTAQKRCCRCRKCHNSGGLLNTCLETVVLETLIQCSTLKRSHSFAWKCRKLIWTALMNPLKINARDYKPARLAFANGAIQRAFSGVGIRVKGASSRGYVKKSFRVSLDEFSADVPSFYGQKTLLLKATAMNPDWTRERLSAYLLKAMGTPVQRMSFAMLYINGMYRGVYQLMENIDKGFLTSRYGNSTGALWKCEPNAAFLNHGRSCSQYLDNYEPQTPLAESSCQPLISLIEVINSPPSPDFEDRLERLLDVDAFLAAYSTEILSANWDGVRNSKNFWLYLPDSSSRFSYFRADLDLAFGSNIFHMGSAADNTVFREGDVLQFGISRGNQLVKRVLNSHRFQNMLIGHLRTLLDGYLSVASNSSFVNTALALHRSVSSAIQQDFWHRLDFSYSYPEFLLCLDTQPVMRSDFINGHPDGGHVLIEVLLDWAAKRINSARRQLATHP